MRQGHWSRVVLSIALSLAGCAKTASNAHAGGAASTGAENDKGSASANLPPQTVALSGKVAISTSGTAAVGTLLSNRSVELQDTTGKTVANGLSDANGNFTILVPGQVAVNATAALTDSESKFQIASIIEDDGGGKVLGVKQPITLTKDKVKSGVADVGNFNFNEIAAIKGIIKFVNPDGSENTKLAKIGTDIYLPGFSLGAKADRDGKFLILYIPPAAYTLRVEKGSLSTESLVTVVANKTLNVGTLVIQTDTVPPVTTASKDSTDFRQPLCVSLTVNKAGSSTYYTIDGSTPTATTPFLYKSSVTSTCGSTTSCPICIAGSSATLKFFSVDLVGNAENQTNKFYYYNEKWADPTDKTAPVTSLLINGVAATTSPIYLTTSATISLSVNEGATIYYTTNGTDPSTSSSIYSGPFTITASTVVKYFSKDWASNTESVATKDIRIYNWFKVGYSSGTTLPVFRDIIYDKSRSAILAVAQNGACLSGGNVDTWTYNHATTTWIKVGTGGPTVCDMALAYNDATQTVYLVAYPQTAGGVSFHTYTYTYGSNTWTDISAGPAAPTGAIGPGGAAAAYDSSTQKILHNYSIIAGNIMNWSTYTAGSFTANNTINNSRNFLHLAYDPIRQRTVAFGSSPGLTLANNGLVYEFYSGSWHDVTTNSVPSVNHFAFDEIRQVMVGFGGGYGSTATANDETWQYDGTDWTKLAPLNSPKPRQSALHVYDSTNKKLVIVGGSDRFNNVLTDMWEYRY